MARRTNPGGQLSPAEVVGRDRLIANLWRILEVQSVLLTAERRIGKTSLIRKMCAQPPTGWHPVFQDLEAVHRAQDFAIAVLAEVQGFLGKRARAAHTARALFEKLGGVEIAGFMKLPESKESPWKALLRNTIQDLATQQGETRLVFFWDEMPYMIERIRQNDGEATAFEVLDVLRELRQTHPTFRMVLTGSIGLHHVLKSLREARYTNPSLNDTETMEVTPLEMGDAIGLARDLMAGEGLRASDTEATARAIAEQVDAFPYYVHALVRHLAMADLGVDPARVAETVESLLASPADPWKLAHYLERIENYYPDEARVVLAILDALATAEDGLDVSAIRKAIHAAGADDDRERLLDLLGRMQQDHYLAPIADRRHRFRFPLIRRWWAIRRGL